MHHGVYTHTPSITHTKPETFCSTEMEDQFHIGMALKNVYLHTLMLITENTYSAGRVRQ